MKMSRKILSLVLALVMVMGLAVTAMADETTPHTITIKNSNTGHTYEAYQVFKGTVTGDDNSPVKILTNIEWGDGVNSAALLAALKNYTDGTADYDNPYKDCSTAEDVANILKERHSDGPRVDAFAEVVSNNLTANIAGSASTIETVTDSEGNTFQAYVIDVKGDGYYFVKDADSVTGNDTVTKYMLRVAKNVTVEPKSDTPKLVKKVKDINDSTDTVFEGWHDGADHDIGDTVPFKLEGTVTGYYGLYTTYKFIFHDQASAGLSFDRNSVKVYVDNATAPISNQFYEVVTSPTDGDTFDIVFNNLKDIPAVKAGSVIRVEYNATLNEQAKIGAEGNPNTAKLEFSNNPYGTGTGMTPEDKVIVFTYKTIINKTDDTGSSPLPGAAFKLEKKFLQAKGVDGAENTYELRPVKEIQTNGTTTFEFAGLDDGIYVLTETKTPAGFNSIDPIEFEIKTSHSKEADNPVLNSIEGTTEIELRFTANKDGGSLTANVINKAGATLPTTGGMGTTIFYVLGAVLVFGAVVLLVTKKRMSADA